MRMFCSKCGFQNEENNKFCTKCGASLHGVTAEKVVVNNEINLHNDVQNSKQICLVCKGEGRIRNKGHMTIGLVLGLIVFPIIAVATGGVALIASICVIVWGVSKKECKTCKGRGYLQIK